MSKFKVGDKVRVINHRPPISVLPVSWAPYMDNYFGKVGTVCCVYSSDVINVVFADEENWCFDPAWLTPVTEATCSGVSIADVFNSLFGSSYVAKKDKINIKTKLINNNKLLTNLKLK